MQLEPQILPDAGTVGTIVADLILKRMDRKGNEPFLLGCPSGRTAGPVYRALTQKAAAGADLSNLVIVMMDDYVIPEEAGRYRIVDAEASYSCLGFARRDILAPLAAACTAAGTNPPNQLWTADPNNPAEYDARIEAAGGIDLFVLASGDSDGHIAFNQPDTPRTAGTHIVELGDATRRDNMDTFPEFTDLAMVPRFGVTVGIDTIARLSAEVVMILTGANKQQAFARLTTAHEYERDWPATIATECRNAALLVDHDAAAIRV